MVRPRLRLSDREIQIQTGDQGQCLKNHPNSITVTHVTKGVPIDAHRGAATTEWLGAHLYYRPGPTIECLRLLQDTASAASMLICTNTLSVREPCVEAEDEPADGVHNRIVQKNLNSLSAFLFKACRKSSCLSVSSHASHIP